MSTGFKVEHRSVPVTIRHAWSRPMYIHPDIRRCELVIGRLGAGKTTFAAIRAKQIAKETGRRLVTNGIDWPDEWGSVRSIEDLEQLHDCVFVWDEINLSMPGERALVHKPTQFRIYEVLSKLRKRDICVIATTQAWTRVSTSYRQLVTMVWLARPEIPGVLHEAIPCDRPEDGGREIVGSAKRVSYRPWWASIPTKAESWHPRKDLT